jgi:hypothetical protein
MRLAGLLLLLAPWISAASWEQSYFYDHDRETLRFTAIAFPSANRGIATGIIVDEVAGRVARSVALITADAGSTWSEVKLNDRPESLFFLDESTGWMVTQRGIWKTEESGRSWKRVSRHSRDRIRKVWFLDAMHGFAVGAEKTVLESHDGGKRWKAVPEAQLPTGNKEFAVYSQIAFVDNRVGLIGGSAVPPTRRGSNAAGRQVPTMTMQMQTFDGGATWRAESAPLLGELAGLRLTRRGGLLLFSFRNRFELLSEVYRLDLRDGTPTSSYQGKDRRVTDLLLFDEHAFLAAVEPPPLAEEQALLPGRIHVLESTDLETWTEMPVDYRANGAWPLLAGPDPEHLFLATDSGMILRLQP